MVPAQQRLDAAHLPGGDIDLRLVVQLQLLALHGAAQGVFQLQRAQRLRLHLGREKAERGTAVALGAVHGHVGGLGEGVEVLSVAGVQGDAHRRRHGQLVVADLIRLAEGFEQLARHARGALRVGAGQQQHEFVAAQARHGVVLAHHGAQAVADLDQQRIAHAVPQRVVDVLEVIEVDEHHRQRCAGAGRFAYGLLAALGQQRAVGQAGQGVVVGQPVDAVLVFLAVHDLAVQVDHGLVQLARAFAHLALQFLVGLGQRLLGALALGDVHGDPHRALCAHGLGADVADHRRAVLAAQRDFAGEGLPLGEGDVAALASVFPLGIAAVPAPRRAADQLARLVAQHLLEVAVAAGEVALAQEHDADHGLVEEHLLFQLDGAQQVLRLLVFVDVVDGPNGPFAGVLGVDQAAREAGPEQGAVAPAHLALAAEGLALAEGGVGLTPQRTESVAVGVQGLAAMPQQFLWAGIAIDFSVTLVAMHHDPVADEDDADPGAVQQGLLFAQGALQGSANDRSGNFRDLNRVVHERGECVVIARDVPNCIRSVCWCRHGVVMAPHHTGGTATGPKEKSR